MRTAICLTMLVLMSGLVVGCGQKGPLERPQQTDTAVPAATQGSE